MSLSNQLHHRHAQGRIGRESRRCLPEILTSHSMGAKCPLLREAKWKIRSCGCCSFLNGWTVGEVFTPTLQKFWRSPTSAKGAWAGQQKSSWQAPFYDTCYATSNIPNCQRALPSRSQPKILVSWYRHNGAQNRETQKDGQWVIAKIAKGPKWASPVLGRTHWATS